jgi:hypothetical protein
MYIYNSSQQDSLISSLSAEWQGALPATFLFDQQGSFVKMLIGRQSEEAFTELLSQNQRERPQ